MLFLLQLGWAFGDAQPAAVVTQLNGAAVVVSPGGGSVTARCGTRLLTGDALRLSPGASATLIYPDRPPATVRAGGAELTLAIAQPKPPTEGTWIARLWAYVVSRLRPEARGAAVGATRPGAGQLPAPVPLRPANTREWVSPPVFSWTPVPGATYSLSLLDAEATPVWSSPMLTECRCAYPADAPPLKPGVRYWWEVRARVDDRASNSPLAWFELLTADEFQRISGELAQLEALFPEGSDPVARHVSRASLLASEGLLADAAAQAQAAAQLRPEDRDLVAFLQSILAGPAPVAEGKE